MTPADLERLKFAVSHVNHHKSQKRLDAALAFRYLNKTYTRPVVDEAIRALGEVK
jgi:hypothetical protein